MWNRVVLLTCGMAFGWGLANYWAAPQRELGKHRYRLAVSAAIGLLLAAALAWEQLSAGGLALAILAGTAAVSYAGNAKQLGKQETQPHARPEMPADKKGTLGVLLIADAEPEAYTGPMPWTERLRESNLGGRPTPHWLLHPYLCHRIRNAYQQMPEGPPSWQALQRLTAEVQKSLGERAVLRAALYKGGPSVPAGLRALAAQGCNRLALLPLDLKEDALTELRRAVVETRVREAGVAVEILPAYRAGLWEEVQKAANWDRLLQGEPLQEAPSLGPDMIKDIVALVEKELAAKLPAHDRALQKG